MERGGGPTQAYDREGDASGGGSGEPKKSSLSLGLYPPLLSLMGGGILFASAPVPGPRNGKKVALLRVPQAESLDSDAKIVQNSWILVWFLYAQVDITGGSGPRGLRVPMALGEGRGGGSYCGRRGRETRGVVSAPRLIIIIRIHTIIIMLNIMNKDAGSCEYSL